MDKDTEALVVAILKGVNMCMGVIILMLLAMLAALPPTY